MAGCSCQSGMAGGPPNKDPGRVHLWPTEGMDPGGIEPPGPQGGPKAEQAGQGAATQMGTPICLQQPGPRQNLLYQAPDQVGRSDSLQRALLAYTPHMYDDWKAHLQEMLDIGAIRKSHNLWTRVVVLVWKKDGSLRFCIDLRKLNNWTIKDAYSLPCIDETLSSFQGSQWFSLLDLRSQYWQVKMDKESKLLTMFTIWPLHFYKCDQMPFRLTSAPVTFQWLIEICLGNLNLNWCIIYLDDIAIF